jgi:hypothetical protein
MKRTIVLVMALALVAVAGFAAGNAEKLDTLEGTLVLIPGDAGQARAMLQLADGSKVQIDLPVREMERLQLRDQAQISVRGVFVGAPSGEQARVLARVVNAEGKEYSIESPIQLTERDRERIRVYDSEQAKLQTGTQTQTQARSQTSTQNQSRTNTTAGSGDSEKSGKK